jgi:AraC-like DNA-binding protein
MKPRVERPNIHADTSACVFCRRSRRFAFDWHLHEEVELTLISRGAGQRFVGDHVERYQPGDLVLLGRRTPHTWASDAEVTDNRAVVAQFRMASVANWPELSSVHRLLEYARIGLAFDAPEAAARVERLVDSEPFTRWVGLLEVLHALAALPAERVRPLASADYAQPVGVADHRAGLVLQYISARFREPMTQAEVAQLIGCSPQAFARFFRRITGRSFTRYVQAMRVAEACRLLIDTGQPVTEVAFRSGFQNLSHFNRVFREQTRCTPSAYRRRHTSKP